MLFYHTAFRQKPGLCEAKSYAQIATQRDFDAFKVFCMATTNLNIRIDKAIKDQAEEIFNELGLNMTTAVNMFLRTAIREHGIPFE